MLAAMIAPRKYVQGRGALRQAGELIRPLGDRVLLIVDQRTWPAAGQELANQLADAGIAVTRADFAGECSEREIARLSEIGRQDSVTVVAGVGGGKILDTAKAVAYHLDAACVSVPTVASTDAPTSALSVIYTDEGVFHRYLILPRNPDLVLVDTEVIARAPVRYLVAGIGDGLSTWVEARANLESRRPAMAGGVATLAAANLAKLCWDTLMTYGPAAVRAVERRAVTLAVERVVEANTLLSGLGFESGGLAAAHAVHNGITALHERTHMILHGEKVAFGTLVQLVLEGRPTDELHAFIDYCAVVGLPTTLAELNLADASESELRLVAERACAPGETIHNMPFAVTPDMVFDAIRAADAIATERRRQQVMAAD